MQTVSGLFDTWAEATAALNALKNAGITSADISLIANSPEDLTPERNVVGEDTAAGAEVGALLGGAGGLLAGLGVLAIPGLGPVIAGGWLFATVIGAVAGASLGAATGGLVGLLTDAGIPKSDAHVYAEGIRRGGALLSARVGDGSVDLATRLMAEAGAVDLEGRRQQFEAEGWDPAVPQPPASTDVRDTYPTVPPLL
jgi:hypothetical protein